MTTLQWALLIGGVSVALLLWALQRSRHAFDLRDALLDTSTGKASLNAIILFLMALLATWVVIDRENDGRDDVVTLLLGVLGIFVTGRLGAQAVNALRSTNDVGSTTETTTKTVIKAPAVPDEPIEVNVVGTPDKPLAAKPKGKK